MVDVKPMTRLQEYVSGLEDGPWYRRVEVAAMLEVTPGAILARSNSPHHPELVPSGSVVYAGADLALYNDEDVKRLREHFQRKSRGSGRPRLWSLDESADRRRRYDLARYHARRVEALLAEGRGGEARKHEERYEAIRAELDNELAERMKKTKA